MSTRHISWHVVVLRLLKFNLSALWSLVTGQTEPSRSAECVQEKTLWTFHLSEWKRDPHGHFISAVNNTELNITYTDRCEDRHSVTQVQGLKWEINKDKLETENKNHNNHSMCDIKEIKTGGVQAVQRPKGSEFKFRKKVFSWGTRCWGNTPKWVNLPS